MVSFEDIRRTGAERQAGARFHRGLAPACVRPPPRDQDRKEQAVRRGASVAPSDWSYPRRSILLFHHLPYDEYVRSGAECLRLCPGRPFTTTAYAQTSSQSARRGRVSRPQRGRNSPWNLAVECLSTDRTQARPLVPDLPVRPLPEGGHPRVRRTPTNPGCEPAIVWLLARLTAGGTRTSECVVPATASAAR
ncbi:MAG: hypothetical protein JWM10_745 [Myxococcaceae bacterium]|nr:hypothetical protein [Myxococcaceae bacterium]